MSAHVWCWILLLVNYVTFTGWVGDEWLGEWMSALVLLLANSICCHVWISSYMGIIKFVFSLQWLLARGQANLKSYQDKVWFCSWWCLDTFESRWYWNILLAVIQMKPLWRLVFFLFFIKSCRHSMLWVRIWDGQNVAAHFHDFWTVITMFTDWLVLDMHVDLEVKIAVQASWPSRLLHIRRWRCDQLLSVGQHRRLRNLDWLMISGAYRVETQVISLSVMACGVED